MAGVPQCESLDILVFINIFDHRSVVHFNLRRERLDRQSNKKSCLSSWQKHMLGYGCAQSNACTAVHPPQN